MVSTYLSFDLVNRDLQKSLGRIAGQTQVVNDAKYYNDNIGKVKTVDEFLGNYRLYNYAMTAYNLTDMVYAKAFMKQVLESDLSDANSFANKLTDDRYKTFAGAFSFGKAGTSTAVPQSNGQLQDTLDLYDQKIATLNDTTQEETRYFKAMLTTSGGITNVDQLLSNSRLRDYMFKAYGIDGNYYDRNAVRGSLVSDPSDPNSYFSKNYAADLNAFNAAKTEDGQYDERTSLNSTVPQLQDSVNAGTQLKGELEQKIADLQAQIDSGTGDQATYQQQLAAAKTQLNSVNGGIQLDQSTLDTQKARLTELNGLLVPADQETQRRKDLAAIMAPLASKAQFSAQMKRLAEDFNFRADGSVPTAGVIDKVKFDQIEADYFAAQPQITHAEAVFNQDVFEQKVKTATRVEDLTNDPRMLQYIKSAFNIDQLYIVQSTVEQIMTNYNGIVDKNLKAHPEYKELYDAFNFDADGIVKGGAGNAQTTAQTDATRNLYFSRWDDKVLADKDTSVKGYKLDMAAIKTADDFLSAKAESTYRFALKAVGIDPNSVSKFAIGRVLKSDLSDPNSYAYKLKDERFLTLAKLFNFDKSGSATTPVMAQTSATVATVAKDYILRQTRFLKAEALTAAKTKATTQSKYYTDTIQRIHTRDELLADRKLVDILLVSKGIDPKTVTNDFLKKAFNSDLSDPKSFVNTQPDKRFAQMVGSFNFNAKGEIDRSSAGKAQNAGEIFALQQLYLRQTLETQKGDENQGVRLALYFERKADTISSAYSILGDEALKEFFRVAFSLPAEAFSMSVDQQAKLIDKNLNLKDLSDPTKLKKLLDRFTTMYDVQNSTATGASAVDILSGSSGATGISADTLFAISQMKR